MDDSWDWYNQTRKLIIAAFEAGEIDYQQFFEMNQKALKKVFGNGVSWDVQGRILLLTGNKTA